MLCLNYKTKIEFLLNTVKNRKNNGYKKEAASFIGRQLLHLNLEPYFTFTL